MRNKLWERAMNNAKARYTMTRRNTQWDCAINNDENHDDEHGSSKRNREISIYDDSERFDKKMVELSRPKIFDMSWPKIFDCILTLIFTV